MVKHANNAMPNAIYTQEQSPPTSTKCLRSSYLLFHLLLPMTGLTLFDMGFFELSVMGGCAGGMRVRHHNFVVIAPMIMKFGTGIKLDVFYTMVTEKLVASLLLRNYDVITSISANT